MNLIDKRPSFRPVTLRDEPNDPMTIDYKFSPSDTDHAVICKLEVMAMQRHRDPIGLETGTATWAEFQAARDSFRGSL